MYAWTSTRNHPSFPFIIVADAGETVHSDRNIGMSGFEINEVSQLTKQCVCVEVMEYDNLIASGAELVTYSITEGYIVRVESPSEVGGEVSDPQPTQQDIDNAMTRAVIAERMLAEYNEVYLWGLGAFGPGYTPSCRHFLVTKEEEERVRYKGLRPVASATVYTVKNAEGLKRHFMIEDGRVVEYASYESAFGDMLLQAHDTHGFVHQGQFVHTHKFSLMWACFELYEPRTAEELVALRVSREKKKAERETRKWIEENPLLAWADSDAGSHEGSAGG